MTNIIEHTTKEIYNLIADEFDLYRVKVWPCVGTFLRKCNSSDLLLDIGCGNGKNIIGNMHLNFKGLDFSEKLVSICQSKNLDVVEASMTSMPYEDNMFDGFIAVASYHHLSNDNDRMKTLNEMYRVLKPGGRGLIVVWASEQYQTESDILGFKKDFSNEQYNMKLNIGKAAKQLTKFNFILIDIVSRL